MKVVLDAGEMATAQSVAAMRSAINRASSVRDGKMGGQSGYQTDLDGIVAEIAFCKWRNVYPDLTIKPRSGSADAVIGDKRVDVKATRYQNGRLLAVTGKREEDADIYVLAIVNDNEVRFAGWAYAHELLRDENLMDLGHGQGYALPQNRLRQFKEEKVDA